MKFLFIISTLFLLSNCANETSADKIKNNRAQATPTISSADNVNASGWTPPPNEPFDRAKLDELKTQNAVFEIVPEEFSNVDFENFKYISSREKKIIPKTAVTNTNIKAMDVLPAAAKHTN